MTPSVTPSAAPTAAPLPMPLADTSPERGTLLLLLAEACLLASRASDAELKEYNAELKLALVDDDIALPQWVAPAPAATPLSPPTTPLAASSATASTSCPAPSNSTASSSAAASSSSAAASPMPGLPTAFASDAEMNLKMCIGHSLSALKLVPSTILRAARSRLVDVYSELGSLYVSTSRSTKACRHYQQGIELFKSTADKTAAAKMSIAFGLALRSRLSAGSAASASGLPFASSWAPAPSLASFPASSASGVAGAYAGNDSSPASDSGRALGGGGSPAGGLLGGTGGMGGVLGVGGSGSPAGGYGGCPADSEYSLAADVSELERCAQAFAQARELLGSREADPALWRLSESEHGRTLLLHAGQLEDRVGGAFPSSPSPSSSSTSCSASSSVAGSGNSTSGAAAHAAAYLGEGSAAASAAKLLLEAAQRLAAAGDATAAGDVHYRLGALHCRLHLRCTSSVGAAAAAVFTAASTHAAANAANAVDVGDADDGAPHGGSGHAAAAAEPHDSLDAARFHFERALGLLPAETHPADHLLVRFDLIKLHRRLRQPHGVAAAIAEQTHALRHLLGTHGAFSAFRFPLPAAPQNRPPAASRAAASSGAAASAVSMASAASVAATTAAALPTGTPPRGTSIATGVANASSGMDGLGGMGGMGRHPERFGSQACALVAAMWPLMEQELHATLKELIRLHGLAERPAHAKAHKALFRLALTQRELHGTGLLAHLHAEWEARWADEALERERAAAAAAAASSAATASLAGGVSPVGSASASPSSGGSRRQRHSSRQGHF